MVHRRKLAIVSALGAAGLAAFAPVPAVAGGCDSYDTAYCGDRDYGYGGYDHRDYGDRDDYRYRGYDDRDDYGDRDYSYRHRYRRYEGAAYYGGDRYDDYDRGYGLACDPDGDRCYRSRSGYWDYHVYYRLHGYRWN